MGSESQALLDLLVERLDESGLDAEAQHVVLAAFAGDDELAEALEGRAGKTPPGEAATASPARPVSAYLDAVTVRGFRGIGPEASLRLQPSPGLTLVVGRNGSGKSSFAEAIEVALTGTSYRWKDRSAVWRAGWRNLHTDEEAAVTVDLNVDGDRGRTVVARGWPDSKDVHDSQASVQRPLVSRAPLSSLGWDRDLATYRPFLSYSELGNMLEGRPSEMYDAVASILGLERVAEAEKRLAEVRKSLNREAKDVEDRLKPLLDRLADSDDPRAREAADALRGKPRDLDRASELATAHPDDQDDHEQETLRRTSMLTYPGEDAVSDAVRELRAAADEVAALRGSDADEARNLAELLERALGHLTRHSGERACPVCGTRDVLDEDWAARTRTEIERLQRTAQGAEAAYARMRRAVQQARGLLAPPPAWLPDDSAVAEVWRDWSAGAAIDDASGLAEHLERGAPGLWAAVEEARTAARRRLDELADRWRPLAADLDAWVRAAREAETKHNQRARVNAGYDWLRTTALGLRNDRLRPLAERSAEVWAELRQESNVELGPVQLAGSGPQRKVTLDVAVDGADSTALGVMSQGELHALALALFLPRATVDDSPFRFLVIDDPVQSMDPAKVDGLARVLSRTAEDRQVIVFTHDARLAEAVRRLQLPATIWQVARRERSVVEVTKQIDPVDRLLDDARALIKTPELPRDVARRVVPGFCREALEAALVERVRHKLLATGVRHAEVEAAIADADSPHTLAALAFFGDADRGDEVLPRLNRYGEWAGDTFLACKRGGHAAYDDDLAALVHDTRLLTERLRDER